MRKVEKNGLGPSGKHAFRHRPSAQETRTASRLRRSRRNGAPSFRPDARRIVPGRGNGYAKHSVGSVYCLHGHAAGQQVARMSIRRITCARWQLGNHACARWGRHAEPARYTFAPVSGPAPDGRAEVRDILYDNERTCDIQKKKYFLYRKISSNVRILIMVNLQTKKHLQICL